MGANGPGCGASGRGEAFQLIGFGCADIVPVLFRQAGSQRPMPAEAGRRRLTTVGTRTSWSGPWRWPGQAASVPLAFWLLAALLGLVPLLSMVIPGDRC